MRNKLDRHVLAILSAGVVVIMSLTALAAVEMSEMGAVFTLDAPEAQSVHLTGDFNGWSESATPMKLAGGLWRVELELAPKRYEYKFLVDGRYIEDPDNPNTNPDPYGGVNSVVTVHPSGEVPLPDDPRGDRIDPKKLSDSSAILFEYQNPNARKVFIAGDFNDWSTEKNPLMNDGNGLWKTTIDISPGKYEYKYYVDYEYIIDPNNPNRVPDPYGGENSIIYVPISDYDLIDDGFRGNEFVEVIDSHEPQTRMQTQPDANRSAEGTEYAFEYYNPGARQVFIAGDFNSWSPNAAEMVSTGEGNWSKKIVLKPGKYGYKYIVDGNWQPDPENPNTQPDGYGGVNSVVEISKSGEIVRSEKAKIADRVSNTFANSRVYIGGKYTGIAESRWNRDGDGRFRLNVPRHRMEAFLRVKISDNVRAVGALSFDTKEAERIYETSLAMDSAAVELVNDNFRAQIYYNRPVGGLGDPLDMVGNSAMAGSPDVEIPFGMGTGGIKAEGALFGAKLTGIYADRYHSRAAQLPDGALLDGLGRPTFGLFAEDVISPSPNPNAYTGYSTDILAARISRGIGPAELGASLRMDSGNWWYSYASMSLPELSEWVDSTGSTSDWFALGKTEWLYGADLRLKIGPTSLWTEYLLYDYVGGVVAGNRENDARDNNGPIDLELGARKGNLGDVGFGIDLFDLAIIGGKYSSLVYSAPKDSGVYLEPAPSISGSGRVDMTYFELVPEVSTTWWESYDLEIGLQRYFPVTLRGGIEKSADSFTDTRRDVRKLGFFAKGSILWDFVLYDICGDWANAEYADGATQFEFLSKYALSINLTENWYVGVDAVFHAIEAISAEDSMLWDGVSKPLFAYIQYSPVQNVRMQVYWGFHPSMANGWVAGRREFVDTYMRENGATFVEAWEELDKVRQIGFRGEIDF